MDNNSNLSEQTIQRAIDAYLAVIASAEKANRTAPPTLQFTSRLGGFPKEQMLNAYVMYGYHKVTHQVVFLRFYAVDHTKNGENIEPIGRIKYSDFLQLEETLDAALAEYRTSRFKKISKKQRHREVNYEADT